MKDFPHISEQLIQALRDSHHDSLKHVKNLEDLHFKQGQQSVIDFLEGMHKKQLNKRSDS